VTASDHPGKRSLFSAGREGEDWTAQPGEDPLMGGTAPTGKEALYSVGPRRPGSVVFACSRCDLITRMSTVEAGIRVLTFSAWIPGKRYSRWLLCPDCRRRTWCRIDWLG
jgi:hypothetical protein